MIEKTLGIYLDRVLPPPNLLYGQSEDGYYHTEFSKKEIELLLYKAGFRIIYQKSTGIFYGKEFIFDYLPCFIPPVKLARVLYRIEKNAFSFWILKYLGEHWEIVAKKIKNVEKE